MVGRMIRHLTEGIIGAKRNGAMSISTATAVSVTLIIIGLFLGLTINLQNITKGVEEDLKISVIVDREYEAEANLNAIEEQISSIEGVKTVEFSSKDQELEYFLSMYDEEERILYMPEGADNPMPHTFYVEVNDGALIPNVNLSINEIEGVQETNYGGESVLLLVEIMDSVKAAGVVLVILLSFLSIYLVQNTIKLTIYARSNEIWIMRYVGAKNGFIRAPFVVEGVLIGLLGAIIPCLFIGFGYYFIYDFTGGVILSSILELVPPSKFINLVCGILLMTSVLVGLIGSFMSVTKYLRLKR